MTIASRAGAASTLSSSPAASKAFVCADTDTITDKHMPIYLCKSCSGRGIRVRRSHFLDICIETQSQTMFYPVIRNRMARAMAAATAATAFALAITGCGTGGSAPSANARGVINAVGAENEYANVLSQIGGRYVHVSAILDNPNTDPHTFEASAQVAQEVSSAQL